MFDTITQRIIGFIVLRLPDMPILNRIVYLNAPFVPTTLSQQLFDEAYFSEVQHDLRNASGFEALNNSMVEWIYRNLSVPTYYNPEVELCCGLKENPADSIIRVQAEIRLKDNADIKKW